MSESVSASILLLAYNQEKYIRDAAKSVLSQEGGPYEILFSDDCSTDDTFEILSAIAQGYKGPHRIILNHNSVNLGIAGHFQKAVSLSSGGWIVAAAGDDISAPNRLRVILQSVSARPAAKAVVSHYYLLDEAGAAERVPDLQIRQMEAMQDMPGVEIASRMLDLKGSNFWVKGATAAWSRDLFEKFEPLPASSLVNEDVVLMFRALMLGNIRVINADLVGYRRHQAAVSLYTQCSGTTEHDLRSARKAFYRTKASLLQSLNDVQFAARTKQISGREAKRFSAAIESLLKYKEVMAEWPWMSVGQRLMSVISLWRPRRVRPGFRKLFARRLPS